MYQWNCSKRYGIVIFYRGFILFARYGTYGICGFDLGFTGYGEFYNNPTNLRRCCFIIFFYGFGGEKRVQKLIAIFNRYLAFILFYFFPLYDFSRVIRCKVFFHVFCFTLLYTHHRRCHFILFYFIVTLRGDFFDGVLFLIRYFSNGFLYPSRKWWTFRILQYRHIIFPLIK